MQEMCIRDRASGCVFTAAISILGIMSLSGVLQMIGTPAEVAAPAQAYLVIIFCGLMTTFLYNFCSAVLRAAGDTRAALFFLAAAVCANLALDLLFVALLHRGVAGAGWATILSQGISVLLCLLYMKQKAPVLLLHRDDTVSYTHLDVYKRQPSHWSTPPSFTSPLSASSDTMLVMAILVMPMWATSSTRLLQVPVAISFKIWPLLCFFTSMRFVPSVFMICYSVPFILAVPRYKQS